MLLDQRRTKRMVKIVSIISALAFAGVIFVVLGVIFAGGGGGGGGDPQKAAVSQAEAATRSNPQDLQAWVDLGRNYEAVGRTTDAQTAYERAISIGPKNADELNSLVAALSANPTRQLSVLGGYVKTHPRDIDAYSTYGSVAEQAKNTFVARLAYQQVLRLAPKDSTARAAAVAGLARLKSAGKGTTTTPATPATPSSPATPARP
jgi:cytochrome c-type biogenesis protein CcmH